MAVVRELLARFGLETDKVSFQRARNGLSDIKKVAIGLGTVFVTGKLAKGIKSFVFDIKDMGDRLDKTSIQLGISSASLQELGFAANLAGVDAVAMSQSLGLLQKNAFEAATGNKKFAEDFARLGINVRDTSGEIKTGEQLIIEMSEGMSRLEGDTKKVALSMNLMGRTGKRLLPLFEGGAAGLEAMRKEARALGGGLDQELIQATVDLQDNLARVDFLLIGLKGTVAKALVPVFDKFFLMLIRLGKQLRGPLSTAIDRIANFVGNLSIAFFQVTDSIAGLFDMLGPLQKRLAKIIGLIAALVILLALPLGFLLILLVLLGLVIDDLVEFGKGGESATGKLINGLKNATEGVSGLDTAINALKALLEVPLILFGGTTLDDLQKAITGVDAVTTAVNALKAAVFTFVQFTTFGLGQLKEGAEGVEFTLGPLGRFLGLPELPGRMSGDIARGIQTATQTPPGALGEIRSGTGGSVINTARTNVQIQINATPGMDEAALMSHAGKVFQSQSDAVNRNTLASFAPSK